LIILFQGRHVGVGAWVSSSVAVIGLPIFTTKIFGLSGDPRRSSRGTLTINPQTLTITANNVTQIYNNVPYNGGNGVTYNGFVNGQNSSVLSGKSRKPCR
jgi:hypothetical protein